MTLNQPGEIVAVHCPVEGDEFESWLRGPVIETIAVAPDRRHAVHVVEPTDYKPEGEDWRPYDGVPQCIARQIASTAHLVWIDTWPRRRR